MSALCSSLIVFSVVVLKLVSGQAIPYTCNSQVYCYGDLLKTIQLLEPPLYTDSKTFVDKKQIYHENETILRFEELMKATGGNPTYDDVVRFVNECFEDGNELEVTEPADWVENPPILKRILDKDLRDWAKELNGRWKNLTRKVSENVRLESDKYSLLYVPNPFVIPGGRFRELYYWDTYWIIRGLLLCNMTTTVKGIIENFLYMIENYGIVPNGGRVYYLKRSQPPLLMLMVANYYAATKDLDFIRTNIDFLEREFDFWMKNRTVNVTVNGRTYALARYYAVSEGPRPESYREDHEEAQKGFDNDERRQEFYEDMKSGAESGWDFSSRWFIKNGTNNGKLEDIHTRYIIPVDLNSFLYLNARTLAKFNAELGNVEKSREYAKIACMWKEAVTAVLWNDDEGSWFDYDILNNIQRKYFYPSNFAPLWTGCYDESNVAVIANKVVNYIERSNIKYYLGGVPTSVEHTTQQWDLPNAWPPLQVIIIQGLEDTHQPNASKLAYELAERWVRANYKGYEESELMYEKYDAEVPGKYGGGGEYTVQTGFGWTNGVIFELLAYYGDRITAKNNRINGSRLLKLLSSAPANEM